MEWRTHETWGSERSGTLVLQVAKLTCAQGQDGHRWLWAGQTVPHLLQGGKHPAHSAIPTTHQHPEAGHLGE
jgi:hypothetical protein